MIGNVHPVSSGGIESMPQTGPLSDDRDPDDLKLAGGPKKSNEWRAPHHWAGQHNRCYCCGADGCNDVPLPTQYYFLCRTCALAAESEVLGRAMSMLKQRIELEIERG